MQVHYTTDRAHDEHKAMELWRRLSTGYRIMVIKYRFLLSTKKLLGIKPLNKVSEIDIKSYPDIPFFKILSEDEAEYFVQQLPRYRLQGLIAHIDDVTHFNCSYCTLVARIQDYEWEIRHHGEKPFSYGAVDPDHCHTRSTGGRRGHYTLNDYD